MTITNQIAIEDFDWGFYNHALNLEKEWRSSLPRFTDKKLLEIFPEVKEIIPERIKALEQKRAEFSDTIKKKLTLIKYKITDEFSRWFWREWVKVNEGEELLKTEKYITRLKILQSVGKGRILKGWLTEEDIQRARSVPIENIINQPLKKVGKILIGLCPLHNEKHPSFRIYTETNSCWCYGCNQGGDVINFAMLLHGLSFPEAVRQLNGI